MNQLFHIIRREIVVKLKSNNFYLFALVTPLLFVFPIVFSVFSRTPNCSGLPACQVGIICHDLGYDTIEYRGLKFFALSRQAVEQVHNDSFDYTNFVGVVDMHNASFLQSHEALQIQLYVPEERADLASRHINDVESFINSEFVYQYGRRHNFDSLQLLKLTNFAKLSLVYSNFGEKKAEVNKAKAMAMGLGMLLYIMFIFYNNNIVKSVSEEKFNKLAEILSMFVKPGKLMIGKIMGLTVASLGQLLIWLFAFTVYTKCAITIGCYLHYISAADEISSFDFSSLLFSDSMLGWIVLFFILGSLLNGSLSTIFAICSSGRGSSVPMILSNMLNLLSIYFCMYAATNPLSSVTYFASYFPLTSYLVIPAILPYGLSVSHIVLSATLLIAISLLLLYLCGRLYRRYLV